MTARIVKTEAHRFISGKNINFREIEVSDAAFVLQLRTDLEKSRFIHKTENNLQKQIEYIQNYKNKDQEWYFIIESKTGEPLGTYRIYDVIDNDDFATGSWIIKNDAPDCTAMESVMLLNKFAFEELGFLRAHFDVRKKNRRVCAFNEKIIGATIIRTGLEAGEEIVFYSFDKVGHEALKKRYPDFLPSNNGKSFDLKRKQS